MERRQFFKSLPQPPDGSLTGPDGLPDGSKICKHLIIRKVDGLTGKSPPGSRPTITICPLAHQGGPSITPSHPTQSNPVQPSPTKSDLSLHASSAVGKGTVKFLALFDRVGLALLFFLGLALDSE